MAFVCCNGRFGSSPVTISGRCLADRVHERSPSRTWFPSCVDRAGDVTRQFTYGWLRPLMVGHRAVVAFLEREIENQKPRPVPGLNVDSKTKVTLARVRGYRSMDQRYFVPSIVSSEVGSRVPMSLAPSAERPAVQQRTPRSRSSVSRPRGVAGAARGVAARADSRADARGVRLLQRLVSRSACR